MPKFNATGLDARSLQCQSLHTGESTHRGNMDLNLNRISAVLIASLFVPAGAYAFSYFDLYCKESGHSNADYSCYPPDAKDWVYNGGVYSFTAYANNAKSESEAIDMILATVGKYSCIKPELIWDGDWFFYSDNAGRETDARTFSLVVGSKKGDGSCDVTQTRAGIGSLTRDKLFNCRPGGQGPFQDAHQGPRFCAYRRPAVTNNCPAVPSPANFADGSIALSSAQEGGLAAAFEFERGYNSFSDYGGGATTGLTAPSTGLFGGGTANGAGWHASYEAHATNSTDSTQTQSVRNIALPGQPPLSFVRQTDGSFKALQANAARLSQANGNSPIYFTLDSGKQYVFTPTGQLQRIVRPDGQSITLTYENSSKPASASDTFGRKMFLRYDAQGLLTQLELPGKRLISYTYDDKSRLIKVDYPADSGTATTQYHYESAALLYAITGITDENGKRVSQIDYLDDGRASNTAQYAAPGTSVNQYQVSFSSGKSVVTDPLGTSRTYRFTNSGGYTRLGDVSQPAGSGCGGATNSIVYDTSGNPLATTDFNGKVTCTFYDAFRAVELTRVEGFNSTCGGYDSPNVTLPTGARKISRRWHPDRVLETGRAEPLKRTTWIYNGQPNPSAGNVAATCAPSDATLPDGKPIAVLCQKTEQATSDANGSQGFTATAVGTPRTWTWTYNPYGQVLTADGPRTDVSDVTTYTYYAADDTDLGKRGNLASVTNALGHITQITAYDLNGNPLTIVDPNGVTTTLTYDLRQRLTSRTVAGETTTYTYDAVGQLLKVTLPDGSYTAYTYDGAHRLTQIADALGNRIVYTLDAMGNRTQEDVQDPAGQLARTRSRIFDALSRLAQDINAQGQKTSYEYDANGNRTKVTDPLNQVTVSQYDALNRLIQVTDPSQGKTAYGWDGQDHLVKVTDPRQLVTSYTVDGLGNASAQTSPDTGRTSRTFDAAGNEASRTDAKKQTTQTTYDALNRPLKVSYADGSSTQYTWDTGTNGLGRLSQIDEYDSANALLRRLQKRYDGFGRVVGETRTIGPVSQTLGYAYTNGQLSTLTLPSGRQLTYSRNAAGQVTQVQLVAGGQTKTLLQSATYSPFGGLLRFQDGAGQWHQRGENQDGQTTSYTLGSQTWLLSYDAAGRITGQVDGSNANNSATYGYDALDHLTGAQVPGTNYAYGYDATGNRTQRTAGTATQAYTVATTSNQLQSVSNPSQAYTYDANGSRTQDGGARYTYDARGRLTQATVGTVTTQYQVNAQGERVRKTSGTSDTLFHYDLAGHLVAESNASGQVTREYVWLDDTPVAVLQ